MLALGIDLVLDDLINSNRTCSRWRMTGRHGDPRPVTYECLTPGGFDNFLSSALADQQLNLIEGLMMNCDRDWSLEQGVAGLGDQKVKCISGAGTKAWFWAVAGIALVLGGAAYAVSRKP